MNEVLRRAMYEANLTEVDVSAELDVDPKTVRNWMHGQLPHAGRRAALIKLLSIDEDVAWPELRKQPQVGGHQPDLVAVYPRRTAIPPGDWLSFFESAESEIGVLAYSAMFLVQDPTFVRLLCDKSLAGVRVRIALWTPDEAAPRRRGLEDEAAPLVARSRSALSLLQPALGYGGVELRLHDTVLYSSLFRVDDQLLVNQRGYGIAAAESPVYHYRRAAGGEIVRSYLASFEAIWSTSEPLRHP